MMFLIFKNSILFVSILLLPFIITFAHANNGDSLGFQQRNITSWSISSAEIKSRNLTLANKKLETSERVDALVDKPKVLKSTKVKQNNEKLSATQGVESDQKSSRKDSKIQKKGTSQSPMKKTPPKDVKKAPPKTLTTKVPPPKELIKQGGETYTKDSNTPQGSRKIISGKIITAIPKQDSPSQKQVPKTQSILPPEDPLKATPKEKVIREKVAKEKGEQKVQQEQITNKDSNNIPPENTNNITQPVSPRKDHDKTVDTPKYTEESPKPSLQTLIPPYSEAPLQY